MVLIVQQIFKFYAKVVKKIFFCSILMDEARKNVFVLHLSCYDIEGKRSFKNHVDKMGWVGG